MAYWKRHKLRSHAIGTEFDYLNEFLVPIIDRVDADDEGYEHLNTAQKTIFCVNAIDGEVCNGGFEQYLTNDSGQFAVETIAALQRIGEKSAAKILRRIVKLFPNGQPAPDRDLREQQFNAIYESKSAVFERANDEFCEESDDTGVSLIEFVRAHEDELIITRE